MDCLKDKSTHLAASPKDVEWGVGVWWGGGGETGEGGEGSM